MAVATTRDAWLEANQRSMAAAVARVRDALRRHAARGRGADSPSEVFASPPQPAEAEIGSSGGAFALDTVCGAFGLTPFERDVLVLCAAMELDASVPSLCAEAQGNPRYAFPTFGLTLAALPGAHWSAISPESPLRRWRLIHMGDGQTLTSSPLRVDERVLHYLTGVPHLDERLRGLVDRVAIPSALAVSHQALADSISESLAEAATGAWQIIQLCGADQLGCRGVVARACERLSRPLFAMRAANLPSSPYEREALARIWEREAALAGSVLLLDCEDGERESLEAATEFVDGVLAPVVVSGNEPLRLRRCQSARFDLLRPGADEQSDIWRASLGSVAERVNGRLNAIVDQFNLTPDRIRTASAQVVAQARWAPPESLGSALWAACRVQARPNLENLAQRITPSARWDDLVLPAAHKAILKTLRIHVRERARVYRQWGFAARYSRGLGISALFAGASGTGKTMAAEVLAGELELDLYRIDLSAVVSKYIGETEKNLRRVFDAPEAGGAILLFDEADALFGKRSEVKDSHDRHANIEISYLLQRMESYRGLAILTTNMKSALDSAFLRRIRFIVDFPFPDARMREKIWEGVFPTETPLGSVNFKQLARLNIAGGNIRNIAMNAAFLAASENEPVQMSHLLMAARTEYAKIEKPLTDAEFKGWAT